jgi:hypothetical protein
MKCPTSVIPALRRLRHEECEFKDSLSNIARQREREGRERGGGGGGRKEEREI